MDKDIEKDIDDIDADENEAVETAEAVDSVEETPDEEIVEEAEVVETVESAEEAAEEPVAEAVAETPAGSAGKSSRNLRKERIGIVVSNKMSKTIVVKIEERVTHSKYSKIMRRSIKFKAHDEKNECDVGDKVLIMETRPISRDKHFRLVRILEKVK